MDDPFKHYPLPPTGLTLLKQFRDETNRMSDSVEALHAEYQARIDACHLHSRKRLRDLWYQIAPLAGVDAEATWNTGGWQVETRYIDSGFGALIYYPRPQHPLAALMGNAPKEEEAELQGAPPGVTKH